MRADVYFYLRDVAKFIVKMRTYFLRAPLPLARSFVLIPHAGILALETVNFMQNDRMMDRRKLKIGKVEQVATIETDSKIKWKSVARALAHTHAMQHLESVCTAYDERCLCLIV